MRQDEVSMIWRSFGRAAVLIGMVACHFAGIGGTGIGGTGISGMSLAASEASKIMHVTLRAPLTTVVSMDGPVVAGPSILSATIMAPDHLPAGVGVGGFVADRHGRWFQCLQRNPLVPGANHVEMRIDETTAMIGEPHYAKWNQAEAQRVSQAGLFIWSMGSVAVELEVSDLRQTPIKESLTLTPTLLDVRYDQQDSNGIIHMATGVRWSMSLTPRPFPVNPFDPQEFKVDAIFTGPNGKEQRIAAFALEPTMLIDRGDRQVGQPNGPCHFVVRWRPVQPGQWTGRLEATWRGQPSISLAMPPIRVTGEPWDDYVRTDQTDVRFFSVDGKWYWPIGVNFHSTFDQRSLDRLGTILTPERGTEAYAARFRRLSLAGGNATEIWMASWNLALEWNADWPGYAGVGRYNQFNAAKLDRVLDDAYANGIRVNLVINNHGQASPNNDREWPTNPWNKVNGGPLLEPYQIFSDEQAYIGQANLRRYLVARYADHPAILGWKLYSEINLTAMGDTQRGGSIPGLPPAASNKELMETRRRWHERAAAHFHDIDNYHHGVTTHWSGDYRKPYPEICALPGIDYICIDAYHGGGTSSERNNTLIDLIYFGMQEPTRGLGKYKKPVWVTEFGATSLGGSSPELAAELASAAWSAMVSGNAGVPMLWWFEWIDQGERWQPFGAIQRFIVGEDFRGLDARSVVLEGTSDQGAIWARAWVRPGRMLAYIADHAWSAEGTSEPLHSKATVRIGSQVSAGPCRVEWWNADEGKMLSVQYLEHAGGALDLVIPAFMRHCAFKLTRTAPPAAQ
jgi:hypothetical protein